MGGGGRSPNNDRQYFDQDENLMNLGAPKAKLLKTALMSSKQLAEHGDNHCWYAERLSCDSAAEDLFIQVRRK